MKPHFRTRFFHCLILVLGLGVLGSCRHEKEKSHEAGTRVQVVHPLVRSVTDYAYFTGRMDAVESVRVQARVTGYLVAIDFEAGAEVKKGQRLFLIDPRPYQAALDRANEQVNLAKARLELAEADYARALEVAKTPGAISQQDIDKYLAQKNEARAAVAAAKAGAESAKLDLEFTRIIAPVDGIVGRNLLTLGNLVKQDDTLLTTVVSQDPIYAYFDIDEHTMLRIERLISEGKVTTVRHGQAMPVEMGLADEGDAYPHQGAIDFVNNRIDPSTGTLQIRGQFSNPLLLPSSTKALKNSSREGAESESKSTATAAKPIRLLTPGMFVRIRLPIGDARKALLVPQAAICSDQGKKYLLVVNNKNLVEYRPITLGPEQPGGLQEACPKAMVPTEKGLRPARDDAGSEKKTAPSLQPTDRVIVSGVQQARPGMTVEASFVDNPSESPSAPPRGARVSPATPKADGATILDTSPTKHP